MLLFNQYVANHAKEVEMMRGMPLSPRVMMAITGPVIGLVSGIVLGLFALAAGVLLAQVRMHARLAGDSNQSG